MNKKISRWKPAIEFPKEIRELAQEFRRQRTAKERADRLAKQKRDAEEKRVRAARLKKGWETATKIFLWANALRESDVGQELMKMSYSRLFFFDDHIIGVPWAGLGIAPNGMFFTHGGRGFSEQYVHSPKDLARAMYTVTLRTASDSIDNGEVWNCIKRRLKQP